MKKISKKMWIIIICIIIVLAVVISILVVKSNKDKVTPSQTIDEYMGYIKDENYDNMYDMLSPNSQIQISKDDFVTRNKNIYEGIEVKNIEITDIQTNKEKNSATYQTSMDTVAGNIKFSNTMSLYRTKEKTYKINWTSNTIFPNLNQTDKIKVTTTEGKRGNILDRDGNMLAGEGKIYSVGLVPGKMSSNKSEDISTISGLLGISTDFINKQLSLSYVKDDTFVALKNISKDNVDLKNNLLKISGVKLVDKDSRVYPYGEATSQLIGYVQSISEDELKSNQDKGYTTNSIIGKSGLEKIYEDTLRGKNGSEIYITDENGNKKETLAKQDMTKGSDVQLTIDSEMQTKIYEEFKNDKSASVAMNPKTGEVLALVSTPTFNSNDFVLGITNDKWNELNQNSNKPLYNRYVSSYAPGSSFKPITAGIGLSENKFTAEEDFGKSGTKWQKDSSWGDSYVTTLATYSGSANLQNALIYSDNIYFAKAALKIGADTFLSHATKLGFGEEIPFVQSLAKSQIASNGKITSDGQLANSGYGQGEVLVNPVHMASIYSAFVNDGNMVKPYIEYKQTPSKEILKQNAFSQDAANIIKQDLIQVVENANGTGHSAKIEGVTLAGKTGTAEIKQSQDDTTGTELGWFNAFIADDNSKTQLLVVSMVEDVKDRGGSHYVVPKVRNIFLQ